MPAEFEDLSRRLTDLESDVAQVRMAGPAAARRRGRERTRNRAVGVAIGSAAAVVIGIGALDAIPQTAPAPPEPIDTPTPEPTPSPTPPTLPEPDPSPSTEDSEPSPLADLLLTSSDLAELESHWWSDVEWTDQARELFLSCLPAAPDGVTQAGGVTFQGGDDAPAQANEQIYKFASGAEAADAVAAFRDTLGQCATEEGNVDLTRTWEYEGIGDGAFQSEIVLPEDVPDAAHRALVGAAWAGSTMVVTVTDIHTRDVFNGEADMLAAAVSRVCDGDCVGELTPRQTYPVPGTEPDDLMLRADDINPVGRYDEFARADVRIDPDRYESFCLPDLVIWGIPGLGGEAPSITQAEWFGPSEGSFHQTHIAYFTEQEAVNFMADHAQLPEQCGEVVETHEQVVNQPASVNVDGADEALVWTIDETVLPTDPGSVGGFSGVGMARAGNVVAVIGFAAFGDPTSGTDGTWADYATQTLAAAIERARG